MSSAGARPIPESDALSMVLPSVTLSVLILDPAVWGVKFAVTVQVSAASSVVALQLSTVISKSLGFGPASVTVSGSDTEPPLLVTVKSCVGVDTLITIEPKLTGVGAMPSTAGPAVAASIAPAALSGVPVALSGVPGVASGSSAAAVPGRRT